MSPETKKVVYALKKRYTIYGKNGKLATAVSAEDALYEISVELGLAGSKISALNVLRNASNIGAIKVEHLTIVALKAKR
jgi:hypothetical protein